MKKAQASQPREPRFVEISDQFWSDLKELPRKFMFEAELRRLIRMAESGKRGSV
mgnify:CR=1 FL=1